MKKILRDSIACGALLLSFLLFSCGGGDKVKTGALTHYVIHDSLSHLVEATDEVVLANVKTVRAQKGTRFEEVSAQGVINYDEGQLSTLSSRVSGRVERLFVKFNYQAVEKGQKLMEVYSPDLVNAQQELLFLHRNNEPVLETLARKKLLLLGFTPQQVTRLLRTGKIDYTVAVYSSASGYVVESLTPGKEAGSPAGSTVISSSSSGGMNGMNSTGGASSTSAKMPGVPETAPISLREGEYISGGQTLFKVLNADKVRAEFFIHPDQLSTFKKGIRISLTSVDSKDKSAETSVNLVQPYYSSGTSYPLVRALVPNKDKRWRIGELVRLDLEEVKKSGTWLPRSAVLQVGGRYVSFVKKDGVFRAVRVDVFKSAGDWMDVGESTANEEVALHAGFLMDSESFIQVDNRSDK